MYRRYAILSDADLRDASAKLAGTASSVHGHNHRHSGPVAVTAPVVK